MNNDEELTPHQEEEAIRLFEILNGLIESTDTTNWKDGEIRPIMGEGIAINKEKAFVFFKDGEGWKRAMNILVNKSN